MTTLSETKTATQSATKTASKKQTTTSKHSKQPAKTTKPKTKEDNKLLYKGKAPKISPRAEGTLSFSLQKNDKGALEILLTGNTNGGIFSKQPIDFSKVVELLKLHGKRDFKSAVLKPVFEGKGSRSANNTSFLVAVLRAKPFKLIIPSSQNQFLSKLTNDFEKQVKVIEQTFSG